MRMKLRVSLVPFLLLSMAPAPLMNQEAPPVQIVVGDTALPLPPGMEPFMENGVTMVPARPVLKSLGAVVTGTGNRLTALQACHSINLESDRSALNLDGQTLPLPVPARKVRGELFVPLRPVAEALNSRVEWDSENNAARIIPQSDRLAGRHQARVTIRVRRAGTIVPPFTTGDVRGALEAGPGTYEWIISPADSLLPRYTWTFLPADGGRPQTISILHDGRTYRVGPGGPDLEAAVEEATLLYHWQYEQAVRAQVGKPSGPLHELDLDTVQALTLPPQVHSVTELCRFRNLTELTLERGTDYSPELLAAAVAQVPGLRSLRLTGRSELPGDPGAAATDSFPYRLESPHGIFLGDTGMDMGTLARYAYDLETIVVRELERDTGLRPTERKPIFVLYGDRDRWEARVSRSTVWGYYEAGEQRIYMAHWKQPEVTNTLLMAHELFHWLAWEEGKVNLPIWLNEGLAHNLSRRIEQRADSWFNPFIRMEWVRVTHESRAIPQLAKHTAQDEYTVTAVGHLLQTRGRDALVPFFALTRDGKEFRAAFTQAFGVTPDQFEAEYREHVKELRADR